MSGESTFVFKPRAADAAEEEENAEGEDGAEAAQEECTAYFTPVVSLTAEVQFSTNEEDEEQLLAERAKLYRWDKASNDWKERGVGDAKILKHKTTGKYRVLMRREQVLKVCANHMILSDMELKENVGNDKAWVYNTPADYSEEEPTEETLCIRFRTPEAAKNFQSIFNEGRKVAAASKSAASPEKTEKTTPTEATADAPSSAEASADKKDA